AARTRIRTSRGDQGFLGLGGVGLSTTKTSSGEVPFPRAKPTGQRDAPSGSATRRKATPARKPVAVEAGLVVEGSVPATRRPEDVQFHAERHALRGAI